MTQQSDHEQVVLTGRINANPNSILNEEILEPQFNYELQYLLSRYILIEKVQLLEYERMGLLGRWAVTRIEAILRQVTPETLIADPTTNMSDIAFAIEQYVQQRLDAKASTWHVDRSRNDFQACAQLMLGRDELSCVVESLLDLAQSVHLLAAQHTHIVMPGYTHYQVAQVISPGFYLTALSDQLLRTSLRLLTVYDEINECPLGGGAMAGQQLPWDRQRMATLLGFSGPQRHALIAVSSREWLLRIAGELSTLSVALSRFVTDFITWGSSEYAFIDLPDELAGISSVMPQKKNFPILERIRGQTAHISAFYADFVLGQRNTPYTNLIEVSKEAARYMIFLFTTTRSVLRLLETVVEQIQFREDRMRAACKREYIWGLTLSNLLALQNGIPWRIAQAITGRYIVLALEQGVKPWRIKHSLLQTACQYYGYEVSVSRKALQDACNIDRNLSGKQSVGSTNPDAVRELLALQETEINWIRSDWSRRKVNVENAFREVDLLFN